MDGGAWWSTVHGVTKSWTRLSDFTFFLSTAKSGHQENAIKTFEIGANMLGFSASGMPVPADPY